MRLLEIGKEAVERSPHLRFVQFPVSLFELCFHFVECNGQIKVLAVKVITGFFFEDFCRSISQGTLQRLADTARSVFFQTFLLIFFHHL